MKAINPATGDLIREYPATGDDELERLLQQAADAFPAWRRRSFAQRAQQVFALGTAMLNEVEGLARLNTLEAGKPVTQAEEEVRRCASICRYYAENAEDFLRSRAVATGAEPASVRYEPLGPLLAIMPWNFPFWQLFRAAVPAIMAGNVVLVKHASNVPGTSLAIGEVFRRAGFPEGVFSVLLIRGSRASQLIGDARIRTVTVTGNEETGRKVAAEAGRHLKKTVLELGGSDPFLVLADADISAAARLGAQARSLNAGQSCTAAKRFLVESGVADAFEAALVEQLQAVPLGDPLRRETQIGPIARQDLLDQLDGQVRRSIGAGAQLRCGGAPLDRRGFFYPPTVLAGVRPGMAAFDEETFGPVAAVTRAESRDQLVDLANQSAYGLAATVVTSDLAEGKRLAAELETGAVFINRMAGYDPELPMGGRKSSGYGRELGPDGIREFVGTKSVWIEAGQGELKGKTMPETWDIPS